MNLRLVLSTSLLASIAFLAAAASLRAADRPANDDFANRQALPSQTQVSAVGATVGASQEPFERTNGGSSPAGGDRNETKTVWYEWTPPVSGSVKVDFITRNTGSTYLLVFRGATPDLDHLSAEGYLPGITAFNVIGGQVYTFSLGNTSFPAAFTLNLSLPSATPTVTITASVPQAVRATGQKGKFLFQLSSVASSDVTLAYKVSGNAVGGTDYKALPGAVTVRAGKNTAAVNVKPFAGGDGATLKVKLTLQPDAAYTVGDTGKAKVQIFDGQ